MGPQSWRPLCEGERNGVVLAVDYPFTGRPEAGFTELVGRLAPDRAVWECVPPQETGLTAEDYLDRWLADVRASGHPVHAVLGFCAGSVYATALADRIAAERGGDGPRLVLFDPEAPNAITVYWQFHKVIDGLGVVLTPEEVGQAQAEGQRISQETEDLGLLGERLLKIFRHAADVAFDRAGLDAVRREDFSVTVTAFMAYLIAAAGIDATAGWRRATAISSRTATNGLNLVPEQQRPGMVAREVRFDIEHADLLRDDAVVRVVAELLG